MVKHVQKITFIVCLLLGTLIPSLQAAEALDAWFKAAQKGEKETLANLLSSGEINIEAKRKGGRTALYFSASNGHLACIQYLVQQGADIEDKTNYKCTALHCSASNGHLGVVKYLLEKGAELEAQDKWKKTALHCSAQEGHIEVVKYLLEQGADIGVKNNNGKTPLDLAREGNRKEVVQLLENPTKCIRAYFKEKMQQQQIAFEAREANLRAEHRNELMQREIAFNDEVERRVTELEATLRAEHQDAIQGQQTVFETRARESQQKEEALQAAINRLNATIERYIPTYFRR